MFDYGCGLFSCDNQDHYGQRTPPSYDLSKINVPLGLYWGGNDILANPTDVRLMIQELPPKIVVQNLFIPSYAHLDFTWGSDANKFVYSEVLKQISKFNLP